MNRMGLRTLAFVGALVACTLAALPGPAFAGAGARHARAFAKAEVAYYANRLPAGLQSLAALPGLPLDIAEGRLDKARLALERIVRQAPKFAQAHSGLAAVYVRLGRLHDARRERDLAAAVAAAAP